MRIFLFLSTCGLMAMTFFSCVKKNNNAVDYRAPFVGSYQFVYTQQSNVNDSLVTDTIAAYTSNIFLGSEDDMLNVQWYNGQNISCHIAPNGDISFCNNHTVGKISNGDFTLNYTNIECLNGGVATRFFKFTGQKQ